MKTVLLALFLCLSVCDAEIDTDFETIADVSSGGTETTKFLTKLPQTELEASTSWKLSDGEPPIGPGKAAMLAIASKDAEYPDFKDWVIRDITLQFSEHGSYYRVNFKGKTYEEETVIDTILRISHHYEGFTYFVLFDSTVITPKQRD